VDNSKFTPTQMGQVGMGTTASGGILGFFGSLAQGVSNSNMYNYQSALSRMNAQIYKQDAEFAIESGQQENLKFGLRAGQQMGQIRAAQGASGFDMNSGSGAMVRSSQETLNRMDMATIRSNAAKTAYNYETQSAMAEGQAGLYKSAANQSLISGAIGGMSSILGTASSVSNEWLAGQRVGQWATKSDGSMPWADSFFGG
jgi:hypothetical protein